MLQEIFLFVFLCFVLSFFVGYAISWLKPQEEWSDFDPETCEIVEDAD